MIANFRRTWSRMLAAARAHPGRSDVILTIVFVMFAFVFNQSAVASMRPSSRVQMTWWRDALVVLSIVPLMLRRARPGPALVALCLLGPLAAVGGIQEFTMQVFATWLTFHAVGAYGVRRRNLVRAVVAGAGLAAVVVGLVLLDRGSASRVDSNEVRLWFISFSVYLAFVGTAWGMGEFSRERRETTELLAQRAEQLERSQSENARRAVLDERVRIARELHDVVAHHVSVMGVQAGAARRVMARDPDQASEALSAIESSSRQAVGEMQRLIGFLRQEGDVDALAPQPGLDQLDRLVSQASTDRLGVEVVRVGEIVELAPSVELSAFRIVQEALTNARKHASATNVVVTLRYGTDALEIEVLDDGSAPVPSTVGGNGLRGMRERVALLGGDLHAGPQPEGGFLVRAHLPLNEASHGQGEGR